MEILHYDQLHPELFPDDYRIAATMGVFDGVHRGHRTLIHRAKYLAETRGGHPWAITFIENPGRVLDPGQFLGSISSLNQKLTLLEAEGLEGILLVPFSHQLRHTGAEEFMNTLSKLLGLDSFTVGENFKLGVFPGMTGKELSGQFPWVDILPLAYHNDEPISSTRIRKAVRNASISEANNLLGHCYTVDLRGIPLLRHGDETQIYHEMVSQVLPQRGEHCVTMVHRDGSRVQGMVTCRDSGLVWQSDELESQIAFIEFDDTYIN